MPTVDEIREYMAKMPELFIPEKAADIEAVIQLDLSGDNGGQWYFNIADGECQMTEGAADNPAMTLKATADDLYGVFMGETNAMAAFMQGKIKVAGDMSLALKMQTMFRFEE